MAGIFGGHLFTVPGLGQTTPSEDAEFSSLISSLSTPTTGSGTSSTSSGTAPKSGAAYMPGAPSPTSKAAPTAAAYIPGVTAAPANNTALYVVGGVAVVGILGLIFMSGRRKSVAANRGRRGRRSRSRRSR